MSYSRTTYLVAVEDTHSDPEFFLFDGYGEAKNKYRTSIEKLQKQYEGSEVNHTKYDDFWRHTATSLCGSFTVRLVPLSLKIIDCDGY